MTGNGPGNVIRGTELLALGLCHLASGSGPACHLGPRITLPGPLPVIGRHPFLLLPRALPEKRKAHQLHVLLQVLCGWPLAPGVGLGDYAWTGGGQIITLALTSHS